MGAVNWNNVSYIKKPFVKKNANTNYGAVPRFKQKSGVAPGHAPSAGHTVAPSPMTASQRAALEALPSVFTIF